jgi:hypothetical protein
MNSVEAFGDHYGRLGNQVFQIALLFAIRARHGHTFYVPRNGEPVWDCFDLAIPSEGPRTTQRFEEAFGPCNFDPGAFEQPDGTAFRGYYQSYRYVEDSKDALLRFLRFHERHRAFSDAMLHAYRRRHGRPVVSVHVRRGDYVDAGVEDAWGDLARDGYYQRAVEAIGDDVVYVVFSDDVGWCRRSLDLGASRVEFADFDHSASLCMMTGCDVSVVANSTFSWWGAYLNPTSEVYAPSRWFGPAMPPPNDRQDDIVPPEWRTIPVFADVVARATRA